MTPLEPERPRVVVVGDVGLDVVARYDGELALGSDTRAEVRVTEGGAGANTAEWLVSCGVATDLIGRVGADAAGRQAREQLAAAGVSCAFGTDPDLPTCCVVVLVDRGGQRTMLPDRGASARLQPADIDPAVLAGATHLHLSGYVLLDATSRPAGLTALAAARAAGLSTSVDPQAAALLTDVEGFLTDIDGVDLLLPNTDELRALTGATGVQAAERLLGSVGAVAVTDGPRGAAWVDRDGIVRVPAVATAYVDPTGCGDAFDAGVLAARLSGATPRASLQSGVEAGARAVSRHGGRP